MHEVPPVPAPAITPGRELDGLLFDIADAVRGRAMRTDWEIRGPWIAIAHIQTDLYPGRRRWGRNDRHRDIRTHLSREMGERAGLIEAGGAHVPASSGHVALWYVPIRRWRVALSYYDARDALCRTIMDERAARWDARMAGR